MGMVKRRKLLAQDPDLVKLQVRLMENPRTTRIPGL
jgi:hypothetical protein